jgi:hypothetical protein
VSNHTCFRRRPASSAPLIQQRSHRLPTFPKSSDVRSSTRLIAPSFAPVQNTSLAPVPERAGSIPRAQGGRYRTVTVIIALPDLMLLDVRVRAATLKQLQALRARLSDPCGSSCWRPLKTNRTLPQRCRAGAPGYILTPCLCGPLRSQFLIRCAAVSSGLGSDFASRAKRNARSLAVFLRSARARCSYSIGAIWPSADLSCFRLKRSSAFSREFIKSPLLSHANPIGPEIRASRPSAAWI